MHKHTTHTRFVHAIYLAIADDKVIATRLLEAQLGALIILVNFPEMLSGFLSQFLVLLCDVLMF